MKSYKIIFPSNHRMHKKQVKKTQQEIKKNSSTMREIIKIKCPITYLREKTYLSVFMQALVNTNI